MLLVVTLCGCLAVANAQSYVPPVSTTVMTTLFQQSSVAPGRVAVDRAGNIYYQNESTSNGPTELYEIPYAAPSVTSTAPVLLLTGLGLYKSEGVFVDPSGDLWVVGGPGFPGTTPTGSSSSENIAFVEIPALNGLPNTAAIPAGGETVDQVAVNNCQATSTTPCVWQNSSFGGSTYGYYIQPADIYVDGSGDVYLVDIYDNGSGGAYNRVLEFNTSTPSKISEWATSLPSNNSAQLTLGGDGNIYYVDSTNGNWSCGCGSGDVYQVKPPVGSTLGVLTQVGSTATIGSSVEIATANGISSDSWGNLYIMSTVGQVSEVPNEAGTINFADEFGIISAADNQDGANGWNYGGSVDAWGNYYGANGNQVYQIQVNGYNFGAINVGSETTSSSTVPSPSLNLYFNASETVAGSVFPTGSPKTNTYAGLLQSFPEDSAATSLAGTSYTAGETVSTTAADFQPIHPGLLKGSYALVNSSGGLETTVNLQGIAAGPQPIFFPGIASLLFNSAATSSTVATPIDLKGPSGIAVDSFGDIFVADSENGRVVADCLSSTTTSSASNSFCAQSGYTGAVVGFGPSFTMPASIALDGANNLYVVDSVADTVTMIQGGTGTSNTLVTSASTFGGTALNGPTGVALDGYGNIYIADTGNNRIVQAHQYGATATDNVVYVSSATTFGGMALSQPSGIALDASGDLFIADTGNNRIVEYSEQGVPSAVSTTGVTLNAPTGVAVLPSGSLVVTDTSNGASLISGGAGSSLSFANTSTGTALNIGKLEGVALDLDGNIYVTDSLEDDVAELNDNSPALASFPSTPEGTTSATVTTEVVNTGTAPLVVSGAALDIGDVNFSILSTSTCAASTNVAEGESCNVETDFAPPTTDTVGAVSGTVTLTDNQLAYTLNTSTVNETATFGASGAQTIALSGAATAPLIAQTINFGSIPTQTVGLPLTLTATASSGLAVTYTSTTTTVCTVSGTTATFLTAGSCAINADQAGNNTYSAATTVSQSFAVVEPTAQTITFGPIANQTVGTTLTLTATASSGLAVTYTSTTPSVCTVSGTTASFLTTGICMIGAGQAGGESNGIGYSAAPQVSQNISVIAAFPPLFAVTASPVSLTIQAGKQSSPITITVTPTTALTSPVTFACSGLPAGATCTFSPASITLPGTTSTQLTISTTSASAAVRPFSRNRFPGTTLALALSCFLVFRKRRAIGIFLVLILGVIGLSMFTGCGGSSSQTAQSVVTVNATSGTLSENATILVSVQN